jgi:hypothetical protein
VHEERGSCRATSTMDGVSGTGRGFDAPETYPGDLSAQRGRDTAFSKIHTLWQCK